MEFSKLQHACIWDLTKEFFPDNLLGLKANFNEAYNCMVSWNLECVRLVVPVPYLRSPIPYILIKIRQA